MANDGRSARTTTCGICGAGVEEKFNFGNQPVSNAFLLPDELRDEEFFWLAVGICASCGMVQLMQETPRTRMFHENYPYRSCSSSIMRKHFERTALHLMETELTRPEDLIVEIGCNDGVLLKAIADAGVRHLGVDASAGAVEVATAKGVRAQVDFFEESTAARIRAEHGPAKVIFAANTFSHIAYIASVMSGVVRLLADDGVFVFEDRYLGDIIQHNYFDQIYDEHFYLFSVRSVTAMAKTFGFELVEAERLPVHGGSLRYKFARPGRRTASALHDLLEREDALGLTRPETFERFGANIRRIRQDLVALLRDLRAHGKTVVGYGATSRSATVTNYCGIGPELIPFVTDTTPGKQGRLTPGSHIPVRPAEEFANPYPDYALLFAWNHADEILAKERGFHDAGGRWIFYVPDVHIV